jgi:hypothetical protein
VHDVGVGEVSNDLDDGVGLPDDGEESVPQPLAGSRAAGESTNSMVAGTILPGFTSSASRSSRLSATGTIPRFGSMVENA